MSSQYIDLNRTRKVYPLVRVKPRFVTVKENLEELEIARIQFSNTLQKDYYFENTYTEVPVVVVTPENDNVNAYITAISTEKVTISLSELPDPNLVCDVYINIQVVGK